MFRFLIASVLIVTGGFSIDAIADDRCGRDRTTLSFVRSDLATIKQRMGDVLAAIPAPGAPYMRENEDWDLPGYSCQDKDGIEPVSIGYRGRYSTEAATEQMGADYQKAMMEAQAKGDYQAIAELGQKMQQQIMQQAAANQSMTPVDLNVVANSASSGTIDPDAVLRDGTGFIAIRTDSNASRDTTSVAMYFDPAALANAQELATFDLYGPFRVESKLDMLMIRIELRGPTNVVDDIVNKVEVSKVLSALTLARHKVE